MLHSKESWRTYQKGLKKETKKKRAQKMLRCTFIAAFLFVLTYFLIDGIAGVSGYYQPERSNPFIKSKNSKSKESDPPHVETWDKEDVRKLISDKNFLNLTQKELSFQDGNELFRVETSLDIPLQEYLLDQIKESYIRYVGFVAMEPFTGRVLAMAGFDKSGNDLNPCTEKVFPAASVFKIITAAAAIETCGLNANSGLCYNGGKYTLYRNQINDKTNKYTHRITLSDSFAQSVNPIFGKLGASRLGKTVLESYAYGFGFNQFINFELPLSKSVISVSEVPYHQAEIASGFNRETRISPLHGAMLACAVLNNGRIPEPTVIDKISNKHAEIIYKNEVATFRQAVSPRTSETLKKLMQATIQRGTCRKEFNGYTNDPVLSELLIGGKTGSINSNEQQVRYDWFVGFAEEKKGERQIAVAAIVAHDKFIGTRASHYAKTAMRHYFENQPSKENYHAGF